MKTQIEFHFPSLDQAAGKIAECVASGYTYVGAVERAGFYYITMEMDVVVAAAEPTEPTVEPVEPEPVVDTGVLAEDTGVTLDHATTETQKPVKKARSSKKVVKDSEDE